MAEVCRFAGVLVVQDLGYKRKRLIVADTDTGEIMLEKQTGDIEHVFAMGANAVQKELMVGREVNEQGMEHITISDYDTPDGNPKVVLQGWRNPLRQKKNEIPKHTGGKPSYVKAFIGESWEALDDAAIGALVKMAINVDWRTGIVVDKRSKLPLNQAGLMSLLGYKSRATLASRITALQDAGALAVAEDGSYVLSRDFIQKG